MVDVKFEGSSILFRVFSKKLKVIVDPFFKGRLMDSTSKPFNRILTLSTNQQVKIRNFLQFSLEAS